MIDRYLCKAKRTDNGEWVEGYYFCMTHTDGRHAHHFIIPFAALWDELYAKPRPVRSVRDETGAITHYESYPWKDIRETRTYRGKPWYVIGNPWVWVIEFERCGKPESLLEG